MDVDNTTDCLGGVWFAVDGVGVDVEIVERRTFEV